MFDWLKRLYGEGTLYFTFDCDDGTAGKAKMPYIGDINTLDRDELISNLKKEVWFKHNKNIHNVKIIL